MNDELERMWKEAVVAWVLRYYAGICLQGLRKPAKNLIMIAGLRPEIWTRDIPNTKQEY
jgi:hypothetical protein